MFGLGKRKSQALYIALIDIGSGSVGCAIVKISSLHENYKIIYSHREWIKVKKSQTNPTDSLRSIKETLLRIGMELGNIGLRKLKEIDSTANFKALQVSVCTPWAYTISRNVDFDSEESIKITDKIISKISNKAEQLAIKSLKEDSIAKSIKFTVIERNVVSVSVNGYYVEKPNGLQTRKLSITHTSSMIRNDILKMITDIHGKLFSDIPLLTHTFLHMHYVALKELSIDTKNICIIDVTGESTEIAVVKDGILAHISHIPFGIHTMVRLIANNKKISVPEAFIYLKSVSDQSLINAQKINTKIISKYEDMLESAFSTIGGAFSIPNAIFVHTNERVEKFFSQHIKNVAELVTHSVHTTHPVTQQIIRPKTKQDSADSALHVSAYFFHKTHTDYD